LQVVYFNDQNIMRIMLATGGDNELA